MHYATIKYDDIANGSGIRTCLFVSGCTHACKGCFNKEAWNFNYGKKFDKAIELKILESLEPGYVAGLSLLGGEPLEPVNQLALVDFLKKVKESYPEKTIWCYTGYIYDTELIKGGRAYNEVTDEILSYIDVMVDGKFIQEEYDISLRFRGSKNQRIIDVQKSIKAKKTILWQDQEIYATR